MYHSGFDSVYLNHRNISKLNVFSFIEVSGGISIKKFSIIKFMGFDCQL